MDSFALHEVHNKVSSLVFRLEAIYNVWKIVIITDPPSTNLCEGLID